MFASAVFKDVTHNSACYTAV